MKRLLILSPFDCDFYDNNRIHHLVGQLRTRFEEVIVLHRRLPVTNAASRWARFAGFFRSRHEIKRDGNVTRVAVTPLFSRPDGTSLAMMRVADPYQEVSSLRTRLTMRFLSLGGLLLDLFCVPSYLFAYFRYGAPRADVTIVQGPWEFLVARALQVLGRAGQVVYDDMDYVPGSYTVSRLKQRAIRALENYSIRRADLVIAVGDLLVDLRRKELGREALLVPNGADIALFSLARIKRPHPPTLIYVGTVLAWAGVDLTIAALARVRKEIGDARLLVCGHTTPDYQTFLNAACERHGVREHVHFLGKMTHKEVVGHMAEADIGMAVFRPVELRKYAFSLKIIEYMAAGLPAITTLGTQSERVVLKHGTGLAVEYSAEAVAEAALLLFKDPARYRSMVARATESSTEYSWDKLILEGLYPALAGGGSDARAPDSFLAPADRRTPGAS